MQDVTWMNRENKFSMSLKRKKDGNLTKPRQHIPQVTSLSSRNMLSSNGRKPLTLFLVKIGNFWQMQKFSVSFIGNIKSNVISL